MCRFRYETMTQTQLGELYGVSSHVIGRWLKEAGLRQGNKLTAEAFQGGYCCRADNPGGDTYFWVWRPAKLVPLLERHGHKMLPLPPVHLIEPPPLSGPFGLRTDANGFSEVINADGSVAALVPGRQQADKLVAVMNVAHKHSIFSRTTLTT